MVIDPRAGPIWSYSANVIILQKALLSTSTVEGDKLNSYYNVHEALHQNCDIISPWIRG